MDYLEENLTKLRAYLDKYAEAGVTAKGVWALMYNTIEKTLMEISKAPIIMTKEQTINAVGISLETALLGTLVLNIVPTQEERDDIQNMAKELFKEAGPKNEGKSN